MFPPFDPTAAAGPFEPLLQRGQYARQRTMTLDDLLLENRIIFLETGPVITDVRPTSSSRSCCTSSTRTRPPTSTCTSTAPAGRCPPRWRSTTRCSSSKCPIHTYCMGMAASGAAVLLAAGTQGQAVRPAELEGDDPPAVRAGRRAGVGHRDPGQRDPASERQRLNEILAKHTGQPIDVIAKETDRDKYYHADEAKAFGLVDEVLARRRTRRSNAEFGVRSAE